MAAFQVARNFAAKVLLYVFGVEGDAENNLENTENS